MRNILLTERQTKQPIDSEIIAISGIDLATIIINNNFGFNWKREIEHDLFAIRILANNKIVGLMALKDFKSESRIQIMLLESSKENIGALKLYDNIAGCLIAFACNIAILNKYQGFVSLIPKTILIEHYKKNYGFVEFGRQIMVDSEISRELVKKYLNG